MKEIIIEIELKHCHKPYLALKRISNDTFVSIAGSIDYNYLKKKYDIVYDVFGKRFIKCGI